ncbi:MAG: hypothetical protein AB8I08_03120 [Sandaracinaceae bacterium]
MEEGITLTGKALSFVLDAVRFHAAYYGRIGEDPSEDEDTGADAGNDAMFLRAIAEDLAQADANRKARIQEG